MKLCYTPSPSLPMLSFPITQPYLTNPFPQSQPFIPIIVLIPWVSPVSDPLRRNHNRPSVRHIGHNEIHQDILAVTLHIDNSPHVGHRRSTSTRILEQILRLQNHQFRQYD
uniref:Uncharacterized protein n=1 Tax=Cucumis sativus TaxID=3659 RepID=A0A0A0LJH7_CUCSA